jgi:quercetin dioxygenase-like cupin family protein
MDLFCELKDSHLETIAPGIKRLVFTLDKVMLAYFELSPGARISKHSHPHEQAGVLISGRLLWTVGGEKRVLEAPALYRIPSGHDHEVEVMGNEKAIVVDAFSPIREDFLTQKTPSYME